MFHVLLVEVSVCLCAGGVYGGAFGAVEHFELYAGSVDAACHFAAECVDFSDELSFCDAADGGVAGHHADVVEFHGGEECLAAESCCGECGFDAGVACADDDDIEIAFHGLGASSRVVCVVARGFRRGMVGDRVGIIA